MALLVWGFVQICITLRKPEHPVHQLVKKTWSIMAAISRPPVDILEAVLNMCGQEGPAKFADFISQDMAASLRLLGVGSFGQAFELYYNGVQSVFKIMPLGTDWKGTLEQLLSEIKITIEMSTLHSGDTNKCPNYVGCYSVQYVEEKYPAQILAILGKLQKERKGDVPYSLKELECETRFVVMELDYAGMSLARYSLDTIDQVTSVIQQVIMSLAVAEEEFKFEHRDLHCGNILILPARTSLLVYKIRGVTYTVQSHGLLVQIIDYTFSRITTGGRDFYRDLNEQHMSQLKGQGGQKEIYYHMKMLTRNNWASHVPSTNIEWMHSFCSSMKSAMGTKYPEVNAILDNVMKEVITFQSVTEFCLKYFASRN